MSYVLLPLFVGWLILKFMWSSLRMVFLLGGTVLTLLLSGALFIIFLLLFMAFLRRTRFSQPVTPTAQAPTDSLQQQIDTWQHVLEKQPTDRDVLWNLSLLYKAKGNDKMAQLYLQKAKQVDPNNPVFKLKLE